MDVAHFLFGARRKSPDVIDKAPAHAVWRLVRPRPSRPVRARRAEADTMVETGQGALKARGGKDFIIDYGDGARAVIRGDIFERTYARIDEEHYVKRTDVVLRAFILDRPAIIKTLEGPQRGEAGDWVVQGVAGELWPVPRAKALSKYEPI